MSNITTGKIKGSHNSVNNNNTFSTWTASKKNFLGIGKDRPDVSFLQEKAPMMYSNNA